MEVRMAERMKWQTCTVLKFFYTVTQEIIYKFVYICHYSPYTEIIIPEYNKQCERIKIKSLVIFLEEETARSVVFSMFLVGPCCLLYCYGPMMMSILLVVYINEICHCHITLFLLPKREIIIFCILKPP